MFRDAVIGIWLGVVTLVTAVFAQSHAAIPKTQEETEIPFQSRQMIQSGMMNVTDIRDNEIKGYFLSRVVYVLEDMHGSRPAVPLDVLFPDAFLGFFATTDISELFSGQGINITLMQERLRDIINTKVGFPLVKVILVQQVDYLEHEDSQSRSRSRKDLLQGDG